MPDHIANRERIVELLRMEFVGPCPTGEPVDCTPVTLGPVEPGEYFRPHYQKENGEEIIGAMTPLNRYGVGVLYPAHGSVEGEKPADEALPEDDHSDQPEPPTLKVDQKTDDQGDDDDDLELSLTAATRPASIGVSFLSEIPEGGSLVVTITGGRYHKKDVQVEGKEARRWWLRSPVSLKESFPLHRATQACRLSPDKSQRLVPGLEDNLDVQVEVRMRPQQQANTALFTVCVVNRTVRRERQLDECCLFQTTLTATVVATDGSITHILPYPIPAETTHSEEEASLRLLYRGVPTFAMGHGCAADWTVEKGAMRAKEVRGEVMPAVETASITPDVWLDAPLMVRMDRLAGLRAGDDGFNDLEKVVTAYREWIREREKEVKQLPEEYHGIGNRHIEACAAYANRMVDGIAYLREDEQAREAFRLANHAVLLQQVRGSQRPRRTSYDEKACLYKFDGEYLPDSIVTAEGRGNWRAFQIAFLLGALRSIGETECAERETVDLLWFPTGGGKTEAYLGLTAFAIFLRRLRDKEDIGVEAIMRYTLRLLTAQQFQRAAGLICAMEHLRKGRKETLGTAQFTIGIWLGTATTPNTRDDALKLLSEMRRGQKASNRLLVSQCPWCGATLGAVLGHGRQVRVPGYEERNKRVVFRCPDTQCRFTDGLPILVVDEDIYETPPSLLIGTVDKFAMLAWRPEARSLFGIGRDGQRAASPPGLIIQDELHLISGPLGSMVGLYETVIEALCTDERYIPRRKPKIISSTATIRGYEDQVQALFARRTVALFPPPGLDVEDSFFARYAKDKEGHLLPGRRYIGIHAPGLTSFQEAQIRAFTALIQAPEQDGWTAEERDPWWTLMAFFNSLRDLGGALSLFQTRVGDYQRAWWARMGRRERNLRSALELTSRIPSDEVPKAIEQLMRGCAESAGAPVDVCLASSIIEVGIDIPRLSLMAVVGQPKSTAQYIQVTGRIGRLWQQRPGLIVTLYSTGRARDRSHYEQFRAYHERLYAKVEPTSVTPFSRPALERALHALMAVYVRQNGGECEQETPYPVPESLLVALTCLLEQRVAVVDQGESGTLKALVKQRREEWRRWERRKWEVWGAPNPEDDAPLMRAAGRYYPAKWEDISWSVPQSMRNVDAECQVTITSAYLQDSEAADA